MFERFNDQARKTVTCAQEEARALNHNYIGTEHLLLGLLRVEDSVAANVLSQFTSLDDVRADVEDTIGRGQLAPTGHIPFTPRAKKVLELGLREALQLGHHYIGTEHILLALVREGEGVAAQVLAKKVELGKLRKAVIMQLSASTSIQDDPNYERVDAFAEYEHSLRDKFSQGSSTRMLVLALVEVGSDGFQAGWDACEKLLSSKGGSE